jgi:hypothetical protein
MLRCTCCGRWTVEAITLDRMRGRGPQTFYRVRRNGAIWDGFLTLAAVETALTEQGVFEYLAEIADAA